MVVPLCSEDEWTPVWKAAKAWQPSREPVLVIAPHPDDETLAETQILAPWTGDFHPDHEACGRAAKAVARHTGATLTFYFFWTWHRGTPRLFQDLPLRSVVLSADQQHAKRIALSRYRSQLDHFSGEPILPDELLWPARCSSEVFSPA